MGENLVLAMFLFVPALCIALLLAQRRALSQRNRRAGLLDVLFANALLLLALIAVLCLAGEVSVRFFYDTTDSFAYSRTTQRWFERYWRINQNGIRDNINYPLEIEHGKRRLTFIGDSFTAGHGIKSVEERFANIIRREQPDWEVHALAIPGYDTGAELALLQGLLQRGYQLDQVVLVYCLNDISDMEPRQQEALRRISAQSKNRPWLLRNSYFLDFLSYRVNARFNPNMRSYYGLISDAYRGPLWETQKSRLLTLRAMVESHGGHLAVVTFPFFHTLGPNYAHIAEHQELQIFWAASGTPHRDLLPIYQGFRTEQLTVNRYDAHPNEKAHAMAASVIAEFVRQQMREHARVGPSTGK